MPSYLDLPRAPNCEARSLVGTKDGITYIVPLRCKSWACIRCAARMTTVWSFRVSDADPQRMITFTHIDNSRAEIKTSLQQVIRDLRKIDPSFQYWGVIELHKSGDPHIHLLQKGEFIHKSKLLEIANKHGWGWSDIRKCSEGFSATRYCAKHLCHSHGRRWPGRLIRYSRKFFTKEYSGADEIEANKEYNWSVVFGRADSIAEKYAKRGGSVSVGELGLDWIMGEEMVGSEVVQRYSRDEKKGYSSTHYNYSANSYVDPEIYKTLIQTYQRCGPSALKLDDGLYDEQEGGD